MTDPKGARAARIAALAFDYAAQPKQAVERCNLCGGTLFVVLTHRDRYGYPAEANGCAQCGLVFINPVMTADAYADFYGGTYRPLVSAYHGRLIDARTIQDEQRVYADERGGFIAPFISGRGFQTMLDIGGSTGVVSRVFADRFGLRGTVVDPAPAETAEARALDLEIVEGLVEQVNFGSRRFDLVVVCQTVDHLLDVSGTLRRLREVTAEGGLLFIDIVDFRAAYLRQWSIEEAIKIDHPYYLTQPTAEALLARAGFAVVKADFAADHLHISYLCRPCPPASDALPARGTVDAMFNEVRFVQNVGPPNGGPHNNAPGGSHKDAPRG
jgi:SAM-dependent methyltransferase